MTSVRRRCHFERNLPSVRLNLKQMIKKVVTKRKLNDSSIKDDLAYWMSKTPEERIAQVEFLRRLYYGNSGRLQRVARVVKRSQIDLKDSGEDD